MPQPYNARDDIADTILQQQNQGGALGAGLTGLAGAMPANMPTQMPAGMPQTPAGGVPGSGMAPAPPSFVPAPPRQQGMGAAMPGMGAMQGMGTMNELTAPPPVGMPPLGVSRRQRMY